MENISLIIVGIFTLVGVFLGFLLTFLKEKREEKEKLKTWKMIIYVELKEQKKKILGMKNTLKQKEKNTSLPIFNFRFLSNFKLISDKIMYKHIHNYDFVNKVLNKDFNIYLEYIKIIKFIDSHIKELSIAKINKEDGKINLLGVVIEDTFKSIDIDELDSIIEKIGKSLGKDRLKFDELKPT